MSGEVRVIVCLTLIGSGLRRTVGFRKPSYVGDPVNTVKLFNDQGVDELVFLDSTPDSAWDEERFEIAREVAGEAFMPMGYGGKLVNSDQIRRTFEAGFEKVVLNTVSVENPAVVREAVETYGGQSIVVSIDVGNSFFHRRSTVYIHCGRHRTNLDPVEHARAMCEAGVGEIMIRSIRHDGTMSGYDLSLVKRVSQAVDVPVVAVGGAGTVEHFGAAVREAGAHAVAAGSMFVYQGPHRAVLVQYPTDRDLRVHLPRFEV